MNLDFQGTIGRLTPAGVPSYDPSRWKIRELVGDEGVAIYEDLPPAGDDSVTMRRVATFKPSPYMGTTECRYLAERIVEDCQAMELERVADARFLADILS